MAVTRGSRCVDSSVKVGMQFMAEKFFMSDDGGRSSSVPPSSARGGSEATRLLKAAADGDAVVVAAILDASTADVNMIRARGSSALHEAAKAGHLGVVQELVGRSASVDSVNRSGCTALHWAALCKDKQRALDVAMYLLKAGAGVNANSEKKDTPLHFASYSTPGPFSDGVCRCLLEWRAVVNTQNRGAESPLMNAVINNNVEVVKVLVEYNADINQKNSLDKTAHDVASDRGCAETLELLEEMQDPMGEMKDVTQQMRSTMAQMKTINALSTELRRQSTMASAYESAAMALVSEIDDRGRAGLAQRAVGLLRSEQCPADAQPLPGRRAAADFQEALAALVLVSRSGGAALLRETGLPSLLPAAERQAAERQVGHRELSELRLALRAGAAGSERSSSPSSDASPRPPPGPASPSTAAGSPAGSAAIGRPPAQRVGTAAVPERAGPEPGASADAGGSARYGSGRPHRRLRVVGSATEAPALAPSAALR